MRQRILVEAERVRSRTGRDPDAPLEQVARWLSGGGFFVHEWAVVILTRRGREALPALGKALEMSSRYRTERRSPFTGHHVDEFHFERCWLMAAEAMIRMAPGEREALPAYGYVLSHGDVAARRAAVGALHRYAEAAVAVLPELLGALLDEDQFVVREAITALGLIGPGAKDTIPDLEELTTNEDRQIAERARAALRQIRRGSGLVHGAAPAIGRD